VEQVNVVPRSAALHDAVTRSSPLALTTDFIGASSQPRGIAKRRERREGKGNLVAPNLRHAAQVAVCRRS
jgi:hypothetical protein